jgi:hypothetical protein
MLARLILPSGNQKRFWRARVAFRARLGVTAEVDLTDDEIAAMLLAADNPKPFLDDDEIAAVVLRAA